MMKNEPLILDAEMVGKTLVPQHVGAAFNHANTINAASVDVAQPGIDADASNGKHRLQAISDILKPSLSNLFLFGCLIGLFVLYCCSCIVHALTLPSRRKHS